MSRKQPGGRDSLIAEYRDDHQDEGGYQNQDPTYDPSSSSRQARAKRFGFFFFWCLLLLGWCEVLMKINLAFVQDGQAFIGLGRLWL